MTIVVIVGADSRKFSLEQLGKARNYISEILGQYLGQEDVTVVSGGCPVGNHRFYDTDHKQWGRFVLDKSPVSDSELERHTFCNFVQTYDMGGVDTLAKIVASGMGMEFLEVPPDTKQWDDKFIDSMGGIGGVLSLRLKGFKSRNIVMAEMADIVYVISPSDGKGGRVWNGGEWTGNYAEKIGKKVIRVAV